MNYGDLTSTEVADAMRGATLIWPIGGLEQHGPHLPLSVDYDIPVALAKEIASRVDGHVLPGQPISARSLPQSGGGLHFPGTVHLRGTTFINYLTDALRSLEPLQLGRLVVINGHYENEAFVFEALDECRGNSEILAFSWWSLVDDGWVAEHVPGFPGWHAEHAGITETSLMMHLRPEVVRPQRPDHETPPRAGIYVHPLDAKRMSTDGVLSRTSGASAELGERLFHHVVDNAVDLIESGYGMR